MKDVPQIKLGDQVFDEKFNIYMVVDKSSGLVKIMNTYPATTYLSYSVYKKQLTFIKDNVWEVKL